MFQSLAVQRDTAFLLKGHIPVSLCDDSYVIEEHSLRAQAYASQQWSRCNRQVRVTNDLL